MSMTITGTDTPFAPKPRRTSHGADTDGKTARPVPGSSRHAAGAGRIAGHPQQLRRPAPPLSARDGAGAARGGIAPAACGQRPPRVALSLPIRIHFSDGAFASGTVVAIDARGMRIETASPAPSSGCVDVRLIPGPHGAPSAVRLPALIMGRNGNVVELLFLRLNEDAEQMLERWLGEAPARTAFDA